MTDHELIQIWVPFPHPQESAKALCDADLANQPAEILRALRALHADQQTPAYNDPTCRAWRGFDAWLAFHGVVYSMELLKRGIEVRELMEISTIYGDKLANTSSVVPGWWDGPHHEQHRARLYRRDPWQYNWTGTNTSLKFEFPGPENEVFRANREVVSLEQEARRLMAQALEARAKADAALVKALQKERIKDEQAEERNAAKFGRNGWKVQ